MSANADKIRSALRRWAPDVVELAGKETADRVRPDAPISPTGEGGRAERGELRRSIKAEPVETSGDRSRVAIVAPVIQAATTDKGARPHVIRATKSHGMLVFYSAREGRTVFVGNRRHPGEVNHPGNAPQNWWEPSLRRHWPEALRLAASRTQFR